MSSEPSEKTLRPLSPHLSVYKPQITTAMSIFHRLTGIALAFGLPVFVMWLLVVAGGPQIYSSFMECFKSPVGQILLFGWSFSFFYHFFCGIRHLLWDAGYFLTIKGVYSTGRIAIGLALVLTLATWLKVYGLLP